MPENLAQLERGERKGSVPGLAKPDDSMQRRFRTLASRVCFTQPNGTCLTLASHSHSSTTKDIPAVTCADINALKQEIAQLRNELRSTPWKKLTHATVGGEMLRLPWKGPDWKTLQIPCPEDVSYLAGFFDGDGCVSTAGLRCRLGATQAYDACCVLVRFADKLGGSVCVQKQGTGLRKPCLEWYLQGKGARHAAGLLAATSLVKHEELAVVADWPKHRKDRALAMQRLRDCKAESGADNSAGHVSWNYMAGFFDAEGCISVKASSRLSLSISQKRPAILERLSSFLLYHGMKSDIHACEKEFRLALGRRADCEAFLKQVLSAGLLVKARQAEIALCLRQTGASHARQVISALSGNQSFGKMLDDAGCLRAREIERMRGKAAHIMSVDRRGFAEAELRAMESLQAQHKVLNAMLERDRLREHSEFIQKLFGRCWA